MCHVTLTVDSLLDLLYSQDIQTTINNSEDLICLMHCFKECVFQHHLRKLVHYLSASRAHLGGHHYSVCLRVFCLHRLL